MQSAKPVTTSEIDEARRKIVLLIEQQVQYGQQTQTLGVPNLAACGQFIGEGASTLEQRGMHGTSAAIGVLANSSQASKEIDELIARLVRYAHERTAANQSVESGRSKERTEADNNNVIKNSELLLAIASLPFTSVTNTEALRRRLTGWLKDSRIDNRGWSYFQDEQSIGPQPLPTAYAVLALDAVNEDVSGPAQYLLDCVRAALKSGSKDIDADVSIRIVALYALTFRKNAGRRSPIDRRLLIQLFDSHWQRVEPLLRTENIEQNVEYWRGTETYYVRVPWQLYLLALAARLRMKRFAGKAARLRLRDIVTNLINGQFRYPHSGKMISTRANGIAHETLGRIRHEMDSSSSYFMYVLRDQIISWRWWGWIAGGLAAAGILYSIYGWLTGEGLKQFIDLAPNFISSFMVFVLLWSRRR